MAIRSREEIINSLSAVVGTDDNALALLEDITDTLTDYETKTADGTDWKRQYEENDAAWRKKYADRFSAPVEESNVSRTPDPEEQYRDITFDDLFK